MSMETRSAKRKRIYKRKFDHDLAIAMAEKGFSAAEIRRHLGNVVSVNAVARVINPRIRARMDEQSRKYLMSGTCAHCGGPRTRYQSRSDKETSGLCRSCWAVTKQTRYRLNEDGDVTHVRCSLCKQWFPGEIFPRNRNKTRGFHGVCKSCGTKKRGEWRERHKVPCIVCGELALPPGEKGYQGAAVARCRKCYWDLRAGRREPVDGEPDVL